MADPSKFVSLGDEEFLREARKIVDAANAEGTALRMLGSLAIYAHSLHFPEGISLFHRVGRERAVGARLSDNLPDRPRVGEAPDPSDRSEGPRGFARAVLGARGEARGGRRPRSRRRRPRHAAPRGRLGILVRVDSKSREGEAA